MTLTAWPIDEHPSDAEVIRQAYGSLIGAAGGLVASGGLAVSQKGTPAMAVLVAGGTPAEGGLWIPGYTATTGPTYFQNSATYEQPIEAAGASNPRIDTIVARVYDTNLDSSGKHEPAIEALRGKEETGVTLAAKKSSPAAVPKNCYILAYVLVPSKAASIVTADIENLATAFKPAAPQMAYTELNISRPPSTNFTPSATRPTLVVGTIATEKGAIVEIQCGGIEMVTGAAAPSTFNGQFPFAFEVPAGAAWKWIKGGETGGSATVTTSYLIK